MNKDNKEHLTPGTLRPKMSCMKNEQIKVNIEPDIKQWLKEQAAERHCSISQIVLELILKAMKDAPTK